MGALERKTNSLIYSNRSETVRGTANDYLSYYPKQLGVDSSPRWNFSLITRVTVFPALPDLRFDRGGSSICSNTLLYTTAQYLRILFISSAQRRMFVLSNTAQTFGLLLVLRKLIGDKEYYYWYTLLCILFTYVRRRYYKIHKRGIWYLFDYTT